MVEKAEDPGRRSFLGLVAATSASLAIGLLAYIGGGFLYPIGKRKPPPLFVCLESAVPEDEPLEIKDPAGRRVLLMRRGTGELMAVSTVCPHLGCAVYYRPEKRIFECPCHQGVFDGEGERVSGPPQRALDRYPTEIREGRVFVQFA